MMRRAGGHRRGLFLVVVVMTLAGMASAGTVTASASPPLHRVAVAPAPGWTASSAAGKPVPDSSVLTLTVRLRLRDAAGAEVLARSVSDPASTSYRHYLTPAQYYARFGLPPDSQQMVGRYLSYQGLTVTIRDRQLAARGTAAQVDHAFDTTLRSWMLRGKQVIAPDSALSVPSSLSGLIAGVDGLDGGPAVLAGVRVPAPRTVSAPTCSDFAFQRHTTLPAAYGRTRFPTSVCGYTPDQIRGAYDTKRLLAAGIDGTGTTVGVLLFGTAVPTVEGDINRFDLAHGVTPLRPGQLTRVQVPSVLPNPPNPDACGGGAGLTGEAESDLELVHTMAPGANLVYIEAGSCAAEDIAAAYQTIVDRHLASVISQSFALYPVDPAVEAGAHQLLVQGAIEGIGFFAGSGDNGDNSPFGLGPFTVWPASDPYETAVGGTSLAVGPDGTWKGELGWGTTLDQVSGGGYTAPLPGAFVVGSGGGASADYAQPAYQRGVVPAALSASSNGPRRVLPDVAAVADPIATPVLIGQTTTGGTYVEFGGGGTSISTPLFAGLEALADQVGGPHGAVNPLLYLLHSTPVFHDVVAKPNPVAVELTNATTPPTLYLDTLQLDTSLYATPGYDNQTGLGSPEGAAYVLALALADRR